jgi:nucleotide-binding universal stress UspA family protein
MLKIERILCPVDFSECSARAYDYAYSLALRYKAKLCVEHVIELVTSSYPYYNFPDIAGNNIYWDLSQATEERLREMVKQQSMNGLQAEMVVHKGFVPDSILAFAQDQRADLIVMGTHGRRGLDRLVMGSVAKSILRKATCPVLAVRKPAHDFINPSQGQDPVQLRKILVCTDFSKCAGAAVKYALSLAQEYDAELTLLHVLEVFPEYKSRMVMEEARRKLEALVPEDVRNWCTVKTSVRVDGKPYQEIIQVAVEEQSDVAILGVRGRSAVDLAVFGSTTDRVLQLGPCPVLAVHDDSRPEHQAELSGNFMSQPIKQVS